MAADAGSRLHHDHAAALDATRLVQATDPYPPRERLLDRLADAQDALQSERNAWSFVWSGPDPLHAKTADTFATVDQLISEAQCSVLIATYNIGLSSEFRELFASIADRLALDRQAVGGGGMKCPACQHEWKLPGPQAGGRRRVRKGFAVAGQPDAEARRRGWATRREKAAKRQEGGAKCPS